MAGDGGSEAPSRIPQDGRPGASSLFRRGFRLLFDRALRSTSWIAARREDGSGRNTGIRSVRPNGRAWMSWEPRTNVRATSKTWPPAIQALSCLFPRRGHACGTKGKRFAEPPRKRNRVEDTKSRSWDRGRAIDDRRVRMWPHWPGLHCAGDRPFVRWAGHGQ